MRYEIVFLLLLFFFNGCINSEEDNPPLFISSKNITVDENQFDVLQVKATDKNRVTYSINNNIYNFNYFDINQTNGILTFKTAPDYEIKKDFQVQVEASDGKNKTIQDINITLKNLNDNLPRLDIITYSVNENTLYIAQLNAEDPDNDKLILAMADANTSLFDLNTSNNKLFFKSPADYEINPHIYNIKLSISDGLHIVDKNISIKLLNLIDTVPILKNAIFSIKENISLGTIVGKIPIIDVGDSPVSNFSLTGSQSNYFSIDPNGTIRTNKNIDYEAIATHAYKFKVFARNQAGNSLSKDVSINIENLPENNIPTLVILMNWNNYYESDAQLWHNKIFNKSYNSVNKWYRETLFDEYSFIAVSETSGTINDGIIMVNMGVNHPGNIDDTLFRDTYIKAAITKPEVINSVDFAALDTNKNGDLDIKEIEIVFIVAGGEYAIGDPITSSIWSHTWSFPSYPAVYVDGISVMKYNGDNTTSGTYVRIGANQGKHSATISVIAHELSHSLFTLPDLYDIGEGSGLGWYDIMSNGTSAKQSSDLYLGSTPTQFSVYSRIKAGLNMNTTVVNASKIVTIKCSANDAIKLDTLKKNEYFLIACRDTEKANSDISFAQAYNSFSYTGNDGFQNRLFAVIYHIDENKINNNENGRQTSSNHYMVSLVEKDKTYLMTSKKDISADYNDVYIQGDIVPSSDTNLFDGTVTGYSIEILNEDYTRRTMTIKIIK